MTSDHDALLRAICENPREDTPRLVFADWLEEHGQAERAAFIRNDIAMSLRDEWDLERLRWDETISGVLSNSRWFAAAYPPANTKAPYYWNSPQLTRRGFRWSANVRNTHPSEFSIEAQRLFATNPIEHLLFSTYSSGVGQFATEPWFQKVTGIGWTDGRCGKRALDSLLNLVPPGLTELELASRAVAPDGMRAIGVGLFKRLTRLQLKGTGPQVLAALLELLEADPVACRLHSLDFHSDPLQEYMRALAVCLPPSLRILRLFHTVLYSTGIRNFVEALKTTELQVLQLTSNAIGNAGATAIFTSPQLAGLKVLDLSYCMVGDEALRALLENSPLVDGLNLLTLTGSPASADMKQAVKDRMGDRVRL